MTCLSSSSWHICGVGAIGSLWASAMVQNDIQLRLLLKDAKQLSAYENAGGITLANASNQMTLHSNPKAYITDKAPKDPIQNLLLTCKSHDTLNAITPWQPYLAENANIVLLQNGMGSAKLLEARFSQANIYGAISTDGVFRKAPFSIVRAGMGETIIGSLSEHLANHEIPPAIESLLALSKPINAASSQVNSSNLKLSWNEDILTQMWHKLAINSAINALTAIYQCKNGELIHHQKAMPRLKQLCLETQDVMSRLGRAPMGQGLFNNVIRVLEQTAPNQSSMLQDFLAGRRTELESINGYIIKQGQLFHLPCAGHKQVYQDLQQLIAQQG